MEIFEEEETDESYGVSGVFVMVALWVVFLFCSVFIYCKLIKS